MPRDQGIIPSTPFLEAAGTLLEIDKRRQERDRQQQEDSQKEILTRLQLDSQGYEGDYQSGFRFNPQKMALRQAAQQGIVPATFQEAAQPTPADLEQVLGGMKTGLGRHNPLEMLQAITGGVNAVAARPGTSRQGFQHALTGQEVVPSEEQLGAFVTPGQAEATRGARQMGARKQAAEVGKTEAETAKLQGEAAHPKSLTDAIARIQGYAQQLKALKAADPGNTGNINLDSVQGDPLSKGILEGLFAENKGNYKASRAQAEGYLKENLARFQQLTGQDISGQFSDLLTGAAPSPLPGAGTRVENAGGTFSTERTIGVNIDGREYVIPTLIGGKQVSPEQAVAEAKKRGLQNYPSFDTPEEANAYATQRSGKLGASQPSSPPPAKAAPKALAPDRQAKLIEQLKENARKGDEQAQMYLKKQGIKW